MTDPRSSLFTGRSDPSLFERFSSIVTRATGTPAAFMLAFAVIVAWGITGPIFHYSDTWQLVINTGTTIVTFLMVFVIQQSQNKDTVAIQLKLNELIAAAKGASNRLIDIEELSDQELEHIKAFYVKLAARAKLESDITQTHSLAEDDDDKLPASPGKP
ncbi:MAG TPA: low affinity iron permease family protein [Kofleriaceae bacterium]|nr:low affinity iron permease family protein [Kofleriaceae bacterium]